MSHTSTGGAPSIRFETSGQGEREDRRRPLSFASRQSQSSPRARTEPCRSLERARGVGQTLSPSHHRGRGRRQYGQCRGILHFLVSSSATSQSFRLLSGAELLRVDVRERTVGQPPFRSVGWKQGSTCSSTNRGCQSLFRRCSNCKCAGTGHHMRAARGGRPWRPRRKTRSVCCSRKTRMTASKEESQQCPHRRRCQCNDTILYRAPVLLVCRTFLQGVVSSARKVARRHPKATAPSSRPFPPFGLGIERR